MLTVRVVYGLFPITELRAFECLDGRVLIDGIGRSGKVLNGGFEISTEEMDSLAKQWLELRKKA